MGIEIGSLDYETMKFGSSPRDTGDKTKVKFESFILPEDIEPFNCNVEWLFVQMECGRRSNFYFALKSGIGLQNCFAWRGKVIEFTILP